jgi:hypothetical protein
VEDVGIGGACVSYKRAEGGAFGDGDRGSTVAVLEASWRIELVVATMLVKEKERTYVAISVRF